MVDLICHPCDLDSLKYLIADWPTMKELGEQPVLLNQKPKIEKGLTAGLFKMAMSVDAKLLKQTKFPLEFSQKVDMKKVNVEVMKKYAVGINAYGSY